MGQKLAPIQSGVMKDNKVFQVVTVIINLIAPKGLHEFVSACIGNPYMFGIYSPVRFLSLNVQVIITSLVTKEAIGKPYMATLHPPPL